jgi:hypothetical protein
MLTTSYPHTIIYPLCDVIEEIILSDNNEKQLKRIDGHINYILFTLNEVIDNDLIKRRVREMFSRIINADDDLKIVKKFACLF